MSESRIIDYPYSDEDHWTCPFCQTEVACWDHGNKCPKCGAVAKLIVYYSVRGP